jgi:3-oxoacyl-[acyl-carrier protein] reductase
VILAITATSARMLLPNLGNFGVACAAIERLCQQLACELGPQGIRVICLRSAGSPDAPGVEWAIRVLAEQAGMSPEAFEASLAETTLLKRLPRLAEVAEMAVLMASDRASAMTGAVANVTCGATGDQGDLGRMRSRLQRLDFIYPWLWLPLLPANVRPLAQGMLLLYYG